MEMKRKTRSYYTQEQKLEIVKMVLNDHKTISEVTKLLGIDRQTIHRWIGEYRELGEKAFIDRSIMPRDMLIKQQNKLLKEKDEEIAILKKVLAYFAERNKKE